MQLTQIGQHQFRLLDRAHLCQAQARHLFQLHPRHPRHLIAQVEVFLLASTSALEILQVCIRLVCKPALLAVLVGARSFDIQFLFDLFWVLGMSR